ncbi:MAG: hypothetical protein ACRDRZ_05445 [Pseudonocardiaceae bacterium]
MSAMAAPTGSPAVVLAEAVRQGRELTPEQRELLAGLLIRVGRAVALLPEAERRYPDDTALASVFEATCWHSVAAEFESLIKTIR